jgi:hypothetical protein
MSPKYNDNLLPGEEEHTFPVEAAIGLIGKYRKVSSTVLVEPLVRLSVEQGPCRNPEI